MIDHVTFGVADFDRALAFYDRTLAPLGVTRLMSVTTEESGAAHFAGYGDSRPFFWIGGGEASSGQMHFAFTAPDRATVDAFHKAALAAGGRDNGPPGVRPHYHANYYGAFVLDPDGRNIEAVCHAPE
ncbi:MAG TPA: VOC family protein [Caulobacteraceae bacterium]|jgi:catechol 2,3-dioxygenase-like lactoylglutathione lyase family enzyme|nr:VOC family protein [Caulobacteraceae bacterium]